MKVKEIFEKELNVTSKEWNVLANYGYVDHYHPAETIQQWQMKMREAMMEDENFEMESGEKIFKGSDKQIIINILNRS